MTIVPTRFGKYLIVRQIGRGGMGDVYEAELSAGPNLSKRVALKLLLTDRKQPESIVRGFIDEAKIAARLSHPNIVQVFECGELDGALYIAMELIDGRDLREVIRGMQGRPMPVEAATYVCCELALALDYIHSLEVLVIHRDVTPHNVFITRDGHVKLGDFGIAKSAMRDSQTVTGQIKGKLAYLAPEQVTGDPVTPRTDLYAVGLILFELATGKRLLDGASEIELIQQARQPRLVAPSSLNPAAAPLDPLVQRLLQPHPTMRLPDAAALARRLQRLLQQRPFDARHLALLVDGLDRRADVDQGAGTVTTPYLRHKPTPRQAATTEPLPRQSLATEATPLPTQPLAGRWSSAEEPAAVPSRASVGGRTIWALTAVVALAAGVLLVWALAPAPSTTQAVDRTPDSQPPDLHRSRVDRSVPPARPTGPHSAPVARAAVDAAPQDLARPRRVTVRHRRRRGARTGAPHGPAEPIPPPPPQVNTALLKRRLAQLTRSAARRGLYRGDTREYTQRLTAARLAVQSGSSGAQDLLAELARHVEGFQIDREFANRKLARLEQAIARARPGQGQRRQLSADAQRILRLIFNNQLIEASRLITLQMRSVTRRARGR